MSVTLLDVWRAARARSVPFSGESAGFAAFVLCEATQHSPRSLTLLDAELGEDGAVRLLSNRPCSEAQAEKELRTLLGRLLEVASSPGPSLFRAAGKGGGASLGLLGEELEKALIPLNRAAARRALVRLFRETARAVEQGKLAPTPDLEEPAQIRLSPPPPVVAQKPVQVAPLAATPEPIQVALSADSAEPRAVAAVAVAPVVAEPVQVAVPPVAPVAAPAPVAPRARTPLPPVSVEPSSEAEQLTSAETVVARRARGLRSTPPPLPPSPVRNETTPRIGSVDETVISVPNLPRQPLFCDVPGDATERVPEVEEISSDDSDLQALAEWPVAQRPLPPEIPQFIGELELPLPRFVSPPELSPDPPTVEPPALRESPALVIGVHVADSDEIAEAVADDELETRPLPSSLSALPVEPIRHLLAAESDVHELLSEFQVREGLSEAELRRELKALAGVDLTPGSALEVGPR